MFGKLGQASNFRRGNPRSLFREGFPLSEGIQLVGTARPSGPSCSSASGAEWAELRRQLEASAKLMEHQREAICRGPTATAPIGDAGRDTIHMAMGGEFT